MALWTGAAPAGEVVEVNLEIVGRSDLAGGGSFGDVAVVGSTAVVASHCGDARVTLVDVKEPRRPAVVSSVPMPPGVWAADLDAAAVLTPSFTGDLLAVGLAPCGPGTGLAALFYDVTDAAGPVLLGEAPPCQGCALGQSPVSIAQRADGRVVSLRPGPAGGVLVDDVTEPRRPTTVGRWSAPEAPGSCVRAGLHSAVLHEDGLRALAVLTDGRVYDLDLADPAQPFAVGAEPPAPGRSGHGAVMPVGARTLAIVADQGPDGACSTEGAPGLRLLELSGGTPRELDPVRFTTAAAPGRLVASGELAYVAWHGDGLRVVDLGQVRARAVAQFVPLQPAVVGVALLPNHVVVVDERSGLYVLERPDEAGARSSFWSDLAGLLPYLGFAGILAAAFVVPRLAMGHAPGRSHVPSPVPEPSRSPRRGH